MTDKDTLIKQQNDFIQLALMPRMVVNQKTLRDEFAMAALTSMLSPVQDITASTPAKAAKLAYQFADAMLEARK